MSIESITSSVMEPPVDSSWSWSLITGQCLTSSDLCTWASAFTKLLLLYLDAQVSSESIYRCTQTLLYALVYHNLIPGSTPQMPYSHLCQTQYLPRGMTVKDLSRDRGFSLTLTVWMQTRLLYVHNTHSPWMYKIHQ